jgi:hypothetical protein
VLELYWVNVRNSKEQGGTQKCYIQNGWDDLAHWCWACIHQPRRLGKCMWTCETYWSTVWLFVWKINCYSKIVFLSEMVHCTPVRGCSIVITLIKKRSDFDQLVGGSPFQLIPLHCDLSLNMTGRVMSALVWLGKTVI